MKLLAGAIAWPLVCAGTAAVSLGQNAIEQTTASTIVGTARLYFTPPRLQELQQRVGRDVVRQQAREDVLRKAEKLLQEDLVSLEYAESGSGQHGNYGRPSSRPQYTSYYRTSRAHNVVLTDGEAQNPEDCARGDRGVVHPGRVRYLMDASGMKYVMADATGPTLWKFSTDE